MCSTPKDERWRCRVGRPALFLTRRGKGAVSFSPFPVGALIGRSTSIVARASQPLCNIDDSGWTEKGKKGAAAHHHLGWLVSPNKDSFCGGVRRRGPNVLRMTCAAVRQRIKPSIEMDIRMCASSIKDFRPKNLGARALVGYLKCVLVPP